MSVSLKNLSKSVRIKLPEYKLYESRGFLFKDKSLVLDSAWHIVSTHLLNYGKTLRQISLKRSFIKHKTYELQF